MAEFICSLLRWQRPGLEMEIVKTRNERRQQRQERFWTGMVILFGCLVFWLGAAVGIQVAGL